MLRLREVCKLDPADPLEFAFESIREAQTGLILTLDLTGKQKITTIGDFGGTEASWARDLLPPSR